MDEINRAGIVTVLTIYGTVQMLSRLAEHRARQDAMSPVAVRYFQMLPYGTERDDAPEGGHSPIPVVSIGPTMYSTSSDSVHTWKVELPKWS